MSLDQLQRATRKGLLKFGNLVENDGHLLFGVCPVVIKRTKTKLKPMLNDLSPYAALTRL